MNLKTILRTVFLAEAWLINGGIGLFCFFFPAAFAAQFSAPLPAAGTEFVRWYGVLLLVLAVVMLRASVSRDDKVLKPAVEGLLAGDLAHLGACGFWFVLVGTVNLGSVAMVSLSVLLAASRVGWLVIDFREKGAAPSWNL